MHRLLSFLISGVIGMLALGMIGQAQAAEKTSPKGILLVAFGTSVESGLASYTGIETAFRAANPDVPLEWAYTSSIIRNKMAKAGKIMFSIDEALDALAAKGIRNLTVQSLHIATGAEFSEMERTILANLLQKPDRFDSVLIGRPLLESERDVQDVMSAILEAFPRERKADEAIVFMAHGNPEGQGDLVVRAMNSGFSERDPLIFVASVEGARGLDDIMADLKKTSVKCVWLEPLMVVAGDHATNDLLGEEDDSWASQLKAAGYEVKGNKHGLGELAGVQKVFVRHAATTEDNILPGGSK